MRNKAVWGALAVLVLLVLTLLSFSSAKAEPKPWRPQSFEWQVKWSQPSLVGFWQTSISTRSSADGSIEFKALRLDHPDESRQLQAGFEQHFSAEDLYNDPTGFIVGEALGQVVYGPWLRPGPEIGMLRKENGSCFVWVKNNTQYKLSVIGVTAAAVIQPGGAFLTDVLQGGKFLVYQGPELIAEFWWDWEQFRWPVQVNKVFIPMALR